MGKTRPRNEISPVIATSLRTGLPVSAETIATDASGLKAGEVTIPTADGPMPEKPTWDLQAGYVKRNAHALPKSGTQRPWVVRQDFFADAFDYRFLDKIDEDMVFGRVRTPAELVG